MRIVLMLIVMMLGACGKKSDSHGHAHAGDENWAVTSWGEKYEIFAECEPLIAGQTAKSHTHVTVLSDFSPLRSGKVSAVLRSHDGAESVFAQDTPARDGIFSVEIAPQAAGSYDLVFRVESGAGNEEIPSGHVRVGTAENPGGLDEGDADHAHAEDSHEDDHAHDVERPHEESAPKMQGIDAVSFLKEQQWRTQFGTESAKTGDVSASVRAPATVRAAAGAEALLTAPLDGVVAATTRVFVGREVKKGEVLVSLAPRASSNMTLPELEAETEVARSRLARLEELLKIGAVSAAEVEAARARLASLEPRLQAAKGSTAGDLAIRAPFDGRVAEARATPGTAVNAGDPLVRIVRTPPVWIEAAVAPRDVARLRGSPTGLSLEAPGAEPLVIEGADLRLVSISPEIDRETGTVTVILEAARAVPYPLGTLVSALMLLPESSTGIVVPSSAVVDDAGTPVIYVQIEGESFDRREIAIVARQGADVVVEGVRAGERVVVLGGNAIRRAALLSSGEVEGHVH